MFYLLLFFIDKVKINDKIKKKRGWKRLQFHF